MERTSTSNTEECPVCTAEDAASKGDIAGTESASEAAAGIEVDAETDAQTGLDVDAVLRSVLADVLGLEAEQTAAFTDDSGLFGELPELDSMAVAGLLTELEDRLDIVIEDDEVDGEMLETFGGLRAYAEAKVAGD